MWYNFYMEKITVLVITFGRPMMIRKTIYGFLKNQNYNMKDLIFHIADNDTEGRLGIKNYVSSIISDFPYLKINYTIEKSAGWGNNANTAIKNIDTDLIFLIEDDREAFGKIDLVNGTRLIHQNKSVGMIRYDGIAGHIDTVLRLKEVNSERYRFSYCEIDQRLSKRPITYSNQPHLRHKRFTEFYGLYPENVKLGHCEQYYARHIKSNPDGPKICILGDGVQNKFYHIGAGNSFQHSEEDTGK